MNNKKQLIGTSVIYLIYVGLIFIANILMEISINKQNETFEALSGIIFGFIAIPVFSLAIPIWLSLKWKLDFSFWPKKKNLLLVLLIMLIFTIIANYKSINILINSGLRLDIFIIHFISILLFHTTYYPLFVLLIFPVLRKSLSISMSIIITALAFSLYHMAQFHFYPAGTTFAIQIFLFSYFVASLLLYLWSESLILVAIVHQIAGAVAVAANGSVHGKIDFLFYLTIPIIAIFFGYMIYQSLKGKDKMKYREKWWIQIKI